MNVLRSVFLAVIAALTVSAQAQLNRYNTMPEASVFLLGQDNFQKELKLTNAQKTTIRKAFEAYANIAMDLMAKYRKDRSNKEKYNIPLRAGQKKLIATSLSALSSDQRIRLGQLGIQYYGIFSVTSPDVASKLKFTQAQSAKAKQYYMTFWNTMDTVSKEQAERMRAVPKPKNPKDNKQVEAYQKQLRAIGEAHKAGDQRKVLAVEKEMEKRTAALLSAAQKQGFEQMKGKLAKVKG